MQFLSLLALAPLATSVLALQDCCYTATTSAGTTLKYRTNALTGHFYDKPQKNDGSGSFCGLTFTRDKAQPDNCAAVKTAVWSGYCSGINPKPATCTSDFVVNTKGTSG